MRSRRAAALIILSLLGLSGCADDAPEPGPRAAVGEAELRDAAAGITADELRDHVAYLASDELAGRDTPSPGLDAAAAYIGDAFGELGLEPAGTDGFEQRYALSRISLAPGSSRLELVTPGGGRPFQEGMDYAVLPGWLGAEEAGAVFYPAGASLDARPGPLHGRVLAVAVPSNAGSAERTRILDAASDAAGAAGAAALLVVLDGDRGTAYISRLAARGSAARRVVGRPVTTFYVTGRVADALFDAAGRARPAADATTPVPLSGVMLRLGAELVVESQAHAPNVVGMLPGSDAELADRYVVLSAHMDHVGVGRAVDGDSIYNGADDNASGTAALIEVAEAFASLPRAPARSVLFLAVSGEEKGLLGSAYFATHPTVPVDGIIANLNADMIGGNAPDTIVVIGQEYSSLGPLVRDIAEERRAELGLTVAADPWPEQRFFFRSDHFNFAAEEIPALFFFAGTHARYHEPSDEPGTVDYEKMTRVARLIFHTGYRIADGAEPPEWSPEGLAEVRALTGSTR